MSKNYTVYHLHSELSLLDSTTNYKLYIDKAVELGQKAICFTEHGNCLNWIEKKEYCDRNGIKYIYGVECYLTETHEEKVKDNYHTILIAKNQDGIREINTLIDASTTPEHTYYKPRISFDEFFNTSDNVIRISACLKSPLNELRNIPDKSEIVEKLIKKYDYLEIQPHNVEDQINYNQWLYQMSLKYNKPLIAGTDTHNIDWYNAECRRILKAAKGIVYDNEDDFDLTYKSYDQLCDMFAAQASLPVDIYLEAIENTNVMADCIETFEIDRSLKYPILYGDKDEQIFKDRINRMYKAKISQHIIDNNPKYKGNIMEEFRVFKKTNMIAFMLFMSELLEWCWQNDIPIGYCRGSVGGSTIAYIIDIIDVNPVVWRTVFSRFCNEDRAGNEIGDIDIDISPSQRPIVQQYIVDRFGIDKTAYVLTTNTIGEKGTIDEIFRAKAYEWKKANPNSTDNPYSLDVAAKVKNEYAEDPEGTRAKYPDIFEYFDGLLGTVISTGFHPAGVIASPITLFDNYGTMWVDGKRVLQINMEECHTLQLAKYDCLGLKNIEIIKDTCEMAHISYPKSHLVNWEDKNVWDHITDSPVGIFQFEQPYAFELLSKYKPTTINHLSMVNAALRPSGTSYRDDLIAHKPCTNPSKIIDDLLADNNGYLIFQEDTIKFLTDICGLSGSEADNVRRAIGRKQTDRLQAALPRILEGYCEKSSQPREIAEEEAKQFLKIISDSSNYQFGYNHSTGYSMIGYTCAMLRYYHPVEFITAYLNNAASQEDINAGTALMKQMEIKLLSARFRHSSDKYLPDVENRAIYKGVASIKSIGCNTGSKLYALKDCEFKTFIDFLKANPCGSDVEKLIDLDYFTEFGKSKFLKSVYNLFSQRYKKENGEYKFKSLIKKDNNPYPVDVLMKYSKETDKQFKIIDEEGFINEIISTFKDEDLPIADRLAAQLDYLGYLEYTNPKAQNWGYITEINTKYTPKLSVYKLDTGEMITLKISKNDFAMSELKEKAIFKFITEDRPKRKLVDGHWTESDETEPWIKVFRIYSK